MKFILFSASVVAMLLRVTATDFFIDYDSGSDADNGLTTGTPWKHHPNDPNATGVSDAQSAGGHRFCFRGGTVYRGRMSLNANSITLSGPTNNAWGTGYAIIDGDYSTNYTASIFVAANLTNITIRELTIQNLGGFADDDPLLDNDCVFADGTDMPSTHYGIALNQGGNRFIHIENVYMNRIGQWRREGINGHHPFASTPVVTGTGIRIDDASDITIINADITHTGNSAVSVVASGSDTCENILIHKCNFHDFIKWPIVLAVSGANSFMKNIMIRKTDIHDYHQYDSGNMSQVCGDSPHSDGVFLQNNNQTTATWTNIVIDSCRFWAAYPESSAGGTASIFSSQGPSFILINSIFTNDRHIRSVDVGTDNFGGNTYKQVCHFYNNLWYNSAKPIEISGTSLATAREVRILNNIYMRSNGGQNDIFVDKSESAPPLPLVMDYDLFYDGTQSEAFRRLGRWAGSFVNRPGLISSWNREHSSKWGNPLFVNATTVAPWRNFHVATNSAARNMGTNLTTYLATIGITAPMDADCYPRPTTGSWDVGPYQYRTP